MPEISKIRRDRERANARAMRPQRSLRQRITVLAVLTIMVLSIMMAIRVGDSLSNADPHCSGSQTVVVQEGDRSMYDVLKRTVPEFNELSAAARQYAAQAAADANEAPLIPGRTITVPSNCAG